MENEPHIGFTWTAPGMLNALIVDVEIGVPDGTKLEYKALVDTGATNTCITKRVADDLALVQTGTTDNHTAGGKVEKAKTYVVDVILKGGTVCFKKINVVEVQLTAGMYDMLIGMDIITLGDFAITHKNGRTRLTFSVPRHRDIDFVSENELHNRLLQAKIQRNQRSQQTIRSAPKFSNKYHKKNK